MPFDATVQELRKMATQAVAYALPRRWDPREATDVPQRVWIVAVLAAFGITATISTWLAITFAPLF